MKPLVTIECDKDHVVKVDEDGKEYRTIRFHCASLIHKPLVYARRILESETKKLDFKPPLCYYCGKPLIRGGVPDEEGLSIHGPK